MPLEQADMPRGEVRDHNIFVWSISFHLYSYIVTPFQQRTRAPWKPPRLPVMNRTVSEGAINCSAVRPRSACPRSRGMR